MLPRAVPADGTTIKSSPAVLPNARPSQTRTNTGQLFILCCHRSLWSCPGASPVFTSFTVTSTPVHLQIGRKHEAPILSPWVHAESHHPLIVNLFSVFPISLPSSQLPRPSLLAAPVIRNGQHPILPLARQPGGSTILALSSRLPSTSRLQSIVLVTTTQDSRQLS